MEAILQGGSHVLDQMKPVGHLLGLWESSLAGPTVAQARPLANTSTCGWAQQPLGEILGADTLGEPDGAATFQVHHRCAGGPDFP